MPHETLKIRPGVDKYMTQTLNEASVNSCNLIRYAPEPSGLGLVQKLGGWERFWPTSMPSTPRALWAWQSTDTHQLLAIGCQTSLVSAGLASSLLAMHVQDGIKTLEDITPLVRADNVSAAVSVTTSSNIATITDTGSNATQYDAVYIPAHIAVGGVILFGFYQAIPASSNSFQVAMTDSQYNPVLPTSSTSGGAVAQYTSTAASSIIGVALTAHGYSVGSTYPILISATVGGIPLGGAYPVLSVPTPDSFTIAGQIAAITAATVLINGGLARYDFYVGGPPPGGASGYGAGGYGAGGYGTGVTPTPGTGNRIDTDDWVLDNWGSSLIADPTSTKFGSIDSATKQGGPLYYWEHTQNTQTAIAIAGGPVINTGFFVAMPQRQIISYGCEEIGVLDPLLVRWCDIGNYQIWNGTPANLAGKYRLTRGSKIVGGIQVGQQGLLLTDVGAWTARFIGSSGGTNLVYSFNEVARGCGLIAQKALAVLGGAAYWMGLKQFWTMGDSGIQALPCPLWDIIFDDLDMDNVGRIRMAANASFGEIALYYPSSRGGGEVDKYVKYNTFIGAPQGWDYGDLSRSAWLDQSVLGEPIGADGTTWLLQQHEVSRNADGQPLRAIFQTGFFTLQQGDVLAFVDQFWPDMRWTADEGTTPNAQILLTFYVAEYPNSTVRTYGPFTLSAAITYITPRFRGRLVALQFESNDLDTFWRLGANRYRYQPAGKFL